MKASRLILLGVGLALGLFLAAQAVASDARLESLALQREYVEDYFNFRTFPTVVARFQNVATIGLGTMDDTTGTFGDDRSVGVIGAGDNTSYGVFAVFLNQVATAVPGIDHAQFDITWAKDFGGTTIGASVLYQNSSVEPGSAKTSPLDGFSQDLDDPNTNVLALTGGAKFGMAENTMLELSAQLGWLSWEDKDATGTVTSEDAGNLSYNLAGRIMAEVSDRSTLVPLVKYTKVDLTADAGGGTELEVTRTTFNAGVAMNYEVNGSDLLVLGLSADYRADKDDVVGTDFSDWSIPTLFLAAEFDAYSWLTLRGGARKTFDSASDDAIDTDAKFSTFQFGLGAGFHFDHFDVDASLNPDWMFSGGYLLSGRTTNVPMTRITASYYF
ncbi:MAG TPA: hypothetical protein VE910_00725 [Dongiaceae bacterium]|jgi:hypothetical protein|nr:hypothetical protein [Dongiaceae bacterium]